MESARWTGRALSGVFILFVLSLPVTCAALIRAVEVRAPTTMAGLPVPQAIVILGGGLRSGEEYGGQTVSSVTLERLR